MTLGANTLKGTSSQGSSIFGLDIYGFTGGAGIRCFHRRQHHRGKLARPRRIGQFRQGKPGGLLVDQCLGELDRPADDQRQPAKRQRPGPDLGKHRQRRRDRRRGINLIQNELIGVSRFDLANASLVTRNGGDGIFITNSSNNSVGAAPTSSGTRPRIRP